MSVLAGFIRGITEWEIAPMASSGTAKTTKSDCETAAASPLTVYPSSPRRLAAAASFSQAMTRYAGVAPRRSRARRPIFPPAPTIAIVVFIEVVLSDDEWNEQDRQRAGHSKKTHERQFGAHPDRVRNAGRGDVES